jgi:Flp pilus assembly protein TadG
MTPSPVSLPSRFQADRRGQVALIFALALVPLLGLAGAALDYSRMTSTRNRLQTAVDQTVLAAAGAAAKLSDTELKAFITKTLAAQMPGAEAWIETVSLSNGRTELEITAGANSAMTLMKLVGFDELPVKAAAKTVITNAHYEIALVLDNSGSMGSSAGGVSKMSAAKTAAAKLVDIMLTGNAASRTKISLVPFTLSVQVGKAYASASWMDLQGKSSIHWQSFNHAASSWKPASRFELFNEINIAWGGCVEARPGTHGVSDSPPNPGDPDSLFVPQFAPDEPGDAGASNYKFKVGNKTTNWSYPNSYLNDNPTPTCASEKTKDEEYELGQKKLCKYKDKPLAITTSGRGPNHNCDAKPLLRLTDSASSLKSSINAMAANGNTDLLEGFAWGWRTLSPNTPFADGKPYNTPNSNKIIILMTDGMNAWNSANNHNKSIYSPFGYYTNNRLGTGATDANAARAQLDAKTLQACTNAKAQNITIYTVGFSTPKDPIDAKGLDLLKQCATSANTAFVASDSDQIVSVFEEIARNIGGLRIAR